MANEQIPEGATPEDVQKAGEVANAAAGAAGQAVAEGGSRDEVRSAVDRAVDEKIRGLQITMSEQDRDAMVDAMIERLDGLGAFAPPPSSDAPAAPEASTPEAAAETAAAAAEAQPAPRKRTIAERFAGI